MELAIHGKQMDVGDALRTHVATKLEEINAKYFNRAIDITVTFAPEGHGFVKTHISLRVGKDIMVTAHATESDAYISFDTTAEKNRQAAAPLQTPPTRSPCTFGTNSGNGNDQST